MMVSLCELEDKLLHLFDQEHSVAELRDFQFGSVDFLARADVCKSAFAVIQAAYIEYGFGGSIIAATDKNKGFAVGADDLCRQDTILCTGHRLLLMTVEKYSLVFRARVSEVKHIVTPQLITLVAMDYALVGVVEKTVCK